MINLSWLQLGAEWMYRGIEWTYLQLKKKNAHNESTSHWWNRLKEKRVRRAAVIVVVLSVIVAIGIAYRESDSSSNDTWSLPYSSTTGYTPSSGNMGGMSDAWNQQDTDAINYVTQQTDGWYQDSIQQYNQEMKALGLQQKTGDRQRDFEIEWNNMDELNRRAERGDKKARKYLNDWETNMQGEINRLNRYNQAQETVNRINDGREYLHNRDMERSEGRAAANAPNYQNFMQHLDNADAYRKNAEELGRKLGH